VEVLLEMMKAFETVEAKMYWITAMVNLGEINYSQAGYLVVHG